MIEIREAKRGKRETHNGTHFQWNQNENHVDTSKIECKQKQIKGESKNRIEREMEYMRRRNRTTSRFNRSDCDAQYDHVSKKRFCVKTFFVPSAFRRGIRFVSLLLSLCLAFSIRPELTGTRLETHLECVRLTIRRSPFIFDCLTLFSVLVLLCAVRSGRSVLNFEPAAFSVRQFLMLSFSSPV